MLPRRLPTLLIAAFAVAFGAAAPAGAAVVEGCDPRPVAVPNQVVVGYTGDRLPKAVTDLLHPVIEIDDRAPHYAIVGIPISDSRVSLLRGLGTNVVRFVEQNHYSCISAVPDDPLVGGMWAVGGANGAGLSGAWDLATAGNVTVAVIDTGIDAGHPDLRTAIWTNPGEAGARADNGRDDDGNGFVDDWRGANTATRRGDGADDHGHGTFVAGLIGARGNNATGIAGAAWESQLMAIKAMGANGLGTSTAIADGIRYAVGGGARIINLSINGDVPDRVQLEAIAEAERAGAIIVASAGNAGRDIDAQGSYPASFPNPAVVGVGSTAQGGGLSAFSNRGLRSVDIAAPGEDVLSTAKGGGYGTASGTSFAAPHVAGTLALLAAARPDADATELLRFLMTGTRLADQLPVRLDAARSLAIALPERAAALGRSTAGSGVLGTTASGVGQGVNAGSGGAAATSATARLTARLGRSARRLQQGRRTLRWTIRGADLARVRRLTVSVDGQTVLRRRVRPRGRTLSLRAPLRLRRGNRRIILRLLDAPGNTLLAQSVRLRVRR